jgi:predicted dehydrogenase
MRGVEIVTLQKGDDVDPTSPKLRRIRGVLVATPGSTHAEVALPFIKQGLPVFIEKPMTTSVRDAERIVRAAQQSGSRVFVGHVHLYNPAYVKLKALLPKIGQIRLIRFEGMAAGPVRDDMSVLWDWGPHGISMALDLLEKAPQHVQAWGYTLPGRRLHDAVQARFLFAPDVQMFLSVSWMSPEKRVKLTVSGAHGSLVFDDTAAHKVTLATARGISHPRHSAQLPLTQELQAFLGTVKASEEPMTGSEQGHAVVHILAAVERSSSLDGKIIKC